MNTCETVLMVPGGIRYILLRSMGIYSICVGYDNANKNETRIWACIQNTVENVNTVADMYHNQPMETQKTEPVHTR